MDAFWKKSNVDIVALQRILPEKGIESLVISSGRTSRKKIL